MKIKIGTRESRLAARQATQVKEWLHLHGYESELVFIKSEGDINLKTPIYKMGIQGVFTRSLDIALLTNQIDVAVHSMKDVPTQLATGVVQAAVLPRGNPKDLLLLKNTDRSADFINKEWPKEAFAQRKMIIGTGSIRRKAQWLHRYPMTQIENMRGNVNTRLEKLSKENWDGALFAAAGLERINLRPEYAIELDWMLPAPAQGAIVVVCRRADQFSFNACALLNDEDTALCTKIERDFLRTLMGGCSTPISALAVRENNSIHFKGNIVSLNGKEKASIDEIKEMAEAAPMGEWAAKEILKNGGQAIAESIRNEK